MLDNPAPQNWNPRACPAPAHGLYLLKVKYPPEVFEESYYQDQGGEITHDCDNAVQRGEVDDVKECRIVSDNA